jgi:glycosyltransferase involved in cell wall biosynthesis
MKRLLILTNSILEYRNDVYDEMSKYYDITVAYYDQKKTNNPQYSTLKLTPVFIGPFVYIKEPLKKIASEFNSCLVMGDMHVISYMMLGFHKKRQYSLTYWGGDVSFSYKKRYDEDRKYDKLRFFLMDKADSLVFYCRYPVKRYIVDGGIDENKLFVANNTVLVDEKIEIPNEKKHFLFVGTLYKEKKIFDLLLAYKSSFVKNKTIQPLYIIGDGVEKENIFKWIENNDLGNKIFLLGAIYDKQILKSYFKDAIACVSPGQAGLSVLTSLAYGVAFVTTRNAITGGEIFNIINGNNGIIYEGNIEDLANILNVLSNDKKLVFELSSNAQKYYYENATIGQMVKGLVSSIKYAQENMKPF